MLKALTLFRKVFNYIVFVLILLLFLRISLTMGGANISFLKAASSFVISVTDIFVIPVDILKSLILPGAPEKYYFKAGYIETIVLVSIAFYLFIRYLIEFFIIKYLDKLERDKKIDSKDDVYYSEWKF